MGDLSPARRGGGVDVGGVLACSPRVAVATAGIINSMGSLGAVVQELVVSNLLEGNAGDTAGETGGSGCLSRGCRRDLRSGSGQPC